MPDYFIGYLANKMTAKGAFSSLYMKNYKTVLSLTVAPQLSESFLGYYFTEYWRTFFNTIFFPMHLQKLKDKLNKANKFSC